MQRLFVSEVYIQAEKTESTMRQNCIMLASVALLFVAGLLFVIISQTHRTKNFPPGPRPIPFFGNLLELNLENPIADLERVKYSLKIANQHRHIKGI